MPSSDPPPVETPQPEAPAPTPAQSQPQSQGKGKPAKAAKTQDGAPPADGKALSGAELKKQAKAEKAARRAQALQEKQGGPPVLGPGSQPSQGQKSDGQKGGKTQHKRTGSTVAEMRNMPARWLQRVVPAPQEPKKEDKTVEFFRHLYKTRTTSIAGASKDIHPAVLALGLQMCNYTICGSCARLVATLQAFKRVSLISNFWSSRADKIRSLNHIQRHLEILSLDISHHMFSHLKLTTYRHVGHFQYQWGTQFDG
jgi:translation initiation factor eIF-2B subunit delta